ncbi:MAG: hypothetical protein MJ180_05600 [Candidatus Gastranaerophilales bacterium]|nr:hypothetical protein [Candidatus Gastranaerophilales bacterium]
MSFSCNPVNRILIFPVKTGYIAKEIAQIRKGSYKVIESCIGKHTPDVAKKQFAKMGYEQIHVFKPSKTDEFTLVSSNK